MCCARLAKNSPSAHHCTTFTLSGCVFAAKACIENPKKMLNSNISSTCIRNMVNFSPLTAEIYSLVRDTAANFNRFLVLASLLHRLTGGQPNFARCLAVWYTTYTFSGAVAPKGILPGAKFTLPPSLAFSYIGSVTARHSSSGRQPNFGVVQGMEFQNFRRGRHLYSAGRP